MEEDFVIEALNEMELDHLNSREPLKGHEKRFAKKLKKSSTKKTRVPFVRIAAAIAVFLSVFGVGKLSQPNPTQVEIASFSQYFNSIIEEKTNVLNQYTSQEERIVILDAMAELSELEQDAQLLHKDLKEGGDPQQIIKAMTENYNSRLQLLDRLTIDLNELKQVKDEITY